MNYILFIIGIYLLLINKINGLLEDDLKFDIAWLGNPSSADIYQKANPNNILNLKTNYNENYRCIIPEIKYSDENKKALTDIYIPVLNVIEPYYTKSNCYYRMESYWFYELCHGKYIKQYHETKLSGNKVVTQEYFLGYYDTNNQPKEYYEENGVKKTHIHWKMFDGKQVPSFAVKYNQGTNCELLENQARETTVFYICDEYGNENIVSFEEISTCKYEIIFTSKAFCTHPSFQIQKVEQDKIQCYAEDNTPIKPYELLNIENDNENFRDDYNKITMTNQDGSLFVIRYKTIDDEDDLNTNINNNNNNNNNLKESQINDNNVKQQKPSYNDNTNADKDIINSFLTGATCLHGGTGWWKYEVCLGKHVIQYHEEDINSPRTVITLGKWNKQSHIDWINNNPNKKPQKKSEKMQLTLFFSNGDLCDDTNKPRHAEVKFKCDKARRGGVALYLLEPAVCEYILAIESPLLCKMIENTDDNGLFENTEFMKPFN